VLPRGPGTDPRQVQVPLFMVVKVALEKGFFQSTSVLSCLYRLTDAP
jgi:hypothetical protein